MSVATVVIGYNSWILRCKIIITQSKQLRKYRFHPNSIEKWILKKKEEKKGKNKYKKMKNKIKMKSIWEKSWNVTCVEFVEQRCLFEKWKVFSFASIVHVLLKMECILHTGWRD